MNFYNWLGVLFILIIELSDNINLVGGIDYCYYKGIYYCCLENVLGVDVYFFVVDVNFLVNIIFVGDVIEVDFGFFGDNIYDNG